MIDSKKSQAEVITTVLLILIAIVAVAVVSVFVISLVRNNLSGTGCFQTTGQVELNYNGDFTSFNQNLSKVLVSIQLGQGVENLSGFSVSLGDGKNSKTYIITEKEASKSDSKISMYGGGSFEIPGAGEKLTYIIDVSSEIPDIFEVVNQIKLSPILNNGKVCDS